MSLEVTGKHAWTVYVSVCLVLVAVAFAGHPGWAIIVLVLVLL